MEDVEIQRQEIAHLWSVELGYRVCAFCTPKHFFAQFSRMGILCENNGCLCSYMYMRTASRPVGHFNISLCIVFTFIPQPPPNIRLLLFLLPCTREFSFFFSAYVVYVTTLQNNSFPFSVLQCETLICSSKVWCRFLLSGRRSMNQRMLLHILNVFSFRREFLESSVRVRILLGTLFFDGWHLLYTQLRQLNILISVPREA